MNMYMFRTAQKTSRGFTLIELLVVIGILAILAVAALTAINPAEAQKKARDVTRLEDMSRIQGVVESYVGDHPGTVFNNTALIYSTDTVSGTNPRDNKLGWLSKALNNTPSGGAAANADLSAYVNTVPVDPSNRTGGVKHTKNDATLSAAGAVRYAIIMTSGGAYKICTYLESTANATKLTQDGEATANDVYSVFSDDALTCTP